MQILGNRLLIILTVFLIAFLEGVFIGNFIYAQLQDTQLIEISLNVPEVAQYLDVNPTATSIINESVEVIDGKLYHVWIVQWFHHPRALSVYIDKSNMKVLQVIELWIGWR
jgi:hypothetical protein